MAYGNRVHEAEDLDVTGDGGGTTQIWRVFSSTPGELATEPDAVAAAIALTPDDYGNAPRSGVRASARLGMDGWELEVTYSFARATPLESAGQPDGPEFEFEIGTQQVKFTQAKAQAAYTPTGAANPAPDMGLAINVTKDGVEGVEVNIPTYSFTERYEFANNYVTGTYKAKVFNLCGKTNSGAFRGFEAGEVLFLGARGSKRGKQPWQIDFRFIASKNLNDVSVGQFAHVTKKGHDYMWFAYAPDVDETASFLIQRPVGAYVARVYESGDFEDLGIGS